MVFLWEVFLWQKCIRRFAAAYRGRPLLEKNFLSLLCCFMHEDSKLRSSNLSSSHAPTLSSTPAAAKFVLVLGKLQVLLWLLVHLVGSKVIYIIGLTHITFCATVRTNFYGLFSKLFTSSPYKTSIEGNLDLSIEFDRARIFLKVGSVYYI